MDQLTAYLTKEAEAAGTHVMPMSAPTSLKNPSPTKTIPKTGMAAVHSLVDTTGKSAPRTVATKTAARYALPHHERYPLDSYLQVKTACVYFAENAADFDLPLRRTFAVNLVERATELGIPVPEVAQQYGSKLAADTTDLEIAIDGRRGVVREELYPLLERVKEAALTLHPEATAQLLSEFDEHAGLKPLYGVEILDPYVSAFAKVAQEQRSPHGAIVVGNEYLAVADLKRFVASNLPALEAMYGEDAAEEFQKDPVGTFESFPLPQKHVLMRMVNTSAAAGSTGT